MPTTVLRRKQAYGNTEGLVDGKVLGEDDGPLLVGQ